MIFSYRVVVYTHHRFWCSSVKVPPRLLAVGAVAFWGDEMATLHIHVDESGEFNFSPSGSRYYIFTAVWTYDPVPLSAELTNLRYSIIKAGHGPNLSGFHACDDPDPRRELVIGAMLRHAQWNFASIVIEKNKVNPSVRDPDMFYPKFLAMLLRFVFRGRVRPGTGNLIIYMDTLPFLQRKKVTAAEIAIKSSCREDLPLPYLLKSATIAGRVILGFRLPIIAAGAYAGNGSTHGWIFMIALSLNSRLPK